MRNEIRNKRILELLGQGKACDEVAAQINQELGTALTMSAVKCVGWRHGLTHLSGGGGNPRNAALTRQAQLAEERERSEHRELLRELKQLQRVDIKRQQYIETIDGCLRPFEPTPLLKPTHDWGHRPEHGWLLDFSDWHLGQLTPIQTTGGIYEQSTEITKWQIDKMMNAIYSIHRVLAQGQEIRNLMALFNGDLIENDYLRPSQARKVDLPVTQQAVEAFDLVGYVLKGLLNLPGVEHIDSHFTGGNHDRTTRKFGNAGLGELDYVDTYAWLIGELTRKAFSEEPRIKVTNWETFFGYTTFMGRKIIFEHGSSFKWGTGSYGGVPWYPVVNAAQRLIDMLGGGDLVVFGHVHRPAALPLGQDAWLLVNGALPATSEYIQSTVKGIRIPTQWLANLHGEHGLIEFHPLYAPPPTLAKQGQIWGE